MTDHSPYPDGFEDWPQEHKNRFFADKAAKNRARKAKTHGGREQPENPLPLFPPLPH
jgi:hypothetical protein